MKTLKNATTIVRVKDGEAESYKKNGFEYCSKTEWKNNTDLKRVQSKTKK